MMTEKEKQELKAMTQKAFKMIFDPSQSWPDMGKVIDQKTAKLKIRNAVRIPAIILWTAVSLYLIYYMVRHPL